MKQQPNELDGLKEVAGGQICGHCGAWGAVYGKKGKGAVMCMDCWKRDAGLLPPLPNPTPIIKRPTIEGARARIEALEQRLARLESSKK